MSHSGDEDEDEVSQDVNVDIASSRKFAGGTPGVGVLRNIKAARRPPAADAAGGCRSILTATESRQEEEDGGGGGSRSWGGGSEEEDMQAEDVCGQENAQGAREGGYGEMSRSWGGEGRGGGLVDEEQQRHRVSWQVK